MNSIKAAVYKDIVEIVGEDQILLDEPLSKHTSFRIGGPADFFVTPNTTLALQQVLIYLRKEGIPFFVIGNGSNLLAHDHGYRGVILQISKNLSGLQIQGQTVIAQSGILLSKLASLIAGQNLSGFEFAAGIPGTLGGAIFMNAGAYGGEMKDVLVSVEVINEKGEQVTLSKEELALGYRTSCLQKENWIAIEAHLHLETGNGLDIRNKMKVFNERRQEKQPLALPSAGSAFKRPEGYYAGKLIMDAGLRGYRIGDAAVSEKHCGFIVNLNQATCKDVIQLVEHIKQVVYEKFDVILEPELRMID